MDSADWCTYELELRFAWTAKYWIQNLQTVWKKCQRLLSTFANVCYFFI